MNIKIRYDWVKPIHFIQLHDGEFWVQTADAFN